MTTTFTSRWLFGLVVLVAAGPSPVFAADNRFDGTWDVALVCPKAPDGALPFTWNFAAAVKDAVLHGEHGAAGQPGFMTLDGPVQPNGAASLTAHGLTGKPTYNLNQTSAGVSYTYAVTAQFGASHGTGQWVTTRTCNFAFKKH